MDAKAVASKCSPEPLTLRITQLEGAGKVFFPEELGGTCLAWGQALTKGPELGGGEENSG